LGLRGQDSSEEIQKDPNTNSEIRNSLNLLLLLDSKVKLNCCSKLQLKSFFYYPCIKDPENKFMMTKIIYFINIFDNTIINFIIKINLKIIKYHEKSNILNYKQT